MIPSGLFRTYVLLLSVFVREFHSYGESVVAVTNNISFLITYIYAFKPIFATTSLLPILALCSVVARQEQVLAELHRTQFDHFFLNQVTRRQNEVP